MQSPNRLQSERTQNISQREKEIQRLSLEFEKLYRDISKAVPKWFLWLWKTLARYK